MYDSYIVRSFVHCISFIWTNQVLLQKRLVLTFLLTYQQYFAPKNCYQLLLIRILFCYRNTKTPDMFAIIWISIRPSLSSYTKWNLHWSWIHYTLLQVVTTSGERLLSNWIWKWHQTSIFLGKGVYFQWLQWVASLVNWQDLGNYLKYINKR